MDHKVTVVGAGHVGATTAQRIAEAEPDHISTDCPLSALRIEEIEVERDARTTHAGLVGQLVGRHQPREGVEDDAHHDAHRQLFALGERRVQEPAELEAVEKRLNQKGWRTKPLSPYDDHYYRRWTHELPPLAHVERQVEIDLHTLEYTELRALMAGNGVDAMLLTSMHNIAYYSGFLYCSFGRPYGCVVTQEGCTTVSANIDAGQPWRRSQRRCSLIALARSSSRVRVVTSGVTSGWPSRSPPTTNGRPWSALSANRNGRPTRPSPRPRTPRCSPWCRAARSATASRTR